MGPQGRPSAGAPTSANPIDVGPKLEDHVAFQWNKMGTWFEEDDEVFVYARDPYKQVDVLQSSRRIQVVVDCTTVVDSNRPWLLFETGLPTRYYIPKHDARMDLLEPSDTVTRCPIRARRTSTRSGSATSSTVTRHGTTDTPCWNA